MKEVNCDLLGTLFAEFPLRKTAEFLYLTWKGVKRGSSSSAESGSPTKMGLIDRKSSVGLTSDDEDRPAPGKSPLRRKSSAGVEGTNKAPVQRKSSSGFGGDGSSSLSNTFLMSLPTHFSQVHPGSTVASQLRKLAGGLGQNDKIRKAMQPFPY